MFKYLKNFLLIKLNKLKNIKIQINKIKSYVIKKTNTKTKKIKIYLKTLVITNKNQEKNLNNNIISTKKYFNYTYITPYNNIVLSSFIRKNKTYIKTKFSKSRAFTKNIVFLGLIINIIMVYELNLLFYNLSINFGYFIYPVYLCLFCISIKYIIKYNLLKNFKSNFIQWLKIIFSIVK